MKWFKVSKWMRWYSKHLIWNITAPDKQLFLTFDDGPDPSTTGWVLDILKSHEVKGTFFCLGKNVQEQPELFDRILKEGHATGNHTYSHEMGWKTTTKKYVSSVEQCADLVQSNLFRPPYGKISLGQIKALKGKYHLIMWSLLSMDYRSDIGADKILHNLLKNIKGGDIIVFHDVPKAEKNLKEVLPAFIARAKEKGFTFAALSESKLPSATA